MSDSVSTSSVDKKLEADGVVGIGGHNEKTIDSNDVDVAALATAGKSIEFTAEEALRIRRKIDWHIMPLMCIMYMMQFADKTTLGQSVPLGLFAGTHINQDQFNWLGTIFYLFFLAFEWPQNLALQYFPVAKWMSLNIFIWAVALLCHAAAKNFGGLFAARVFLGICEGAITPAFLLVTSMFYTRQEQSQRVGYWFLMNGFAVIMLGLVSYGVLHAHTGKFAPWQWLMVITGVITLIVSVLFWFFFPDSPHTAWFLTPEERIIAVERLKVNQSGVENKTFKREQFYECLRDPKTYLFFFMAAISNVTNSLSNQRQIIVAGFGFNPLQTTLIGCVDGVVEIIVIACTVTSATYWKQGRAYSATIAYCVAIFGSILVNALSSSHKVGLLFAYWISITSIAPFVIILAWGAATTAGHTKRTTMNAVLMIGYAVGNSAGPQYWKKAYQPRNHIPWAILSACWAATAVLLLVTRVYLARENRLRDAEPYDAKYDEVYISEEKDGKKEDVKVAKEFLDLTDVQNREFRYVL
ncbi:MFS general substrate transporter [Trametopsis cervina]|nr:MFS general substrate transporter [Trametopsis cervina]